MSNYDNNPYNNNAGGGGGGFVAGGSPYGSQGDSPGGGKKVRLNTIRPLTIKQVLSASQVHADADFQVDGVDVAQVIIVGSVHNQSTSATNVSYEIGDGTGYVDVRLWLDSADDESGKTSGIEQDKYISVLGSLKVFGGKRHISATHVRLITDPNEIAHHALKAQWVSLSLRGASEGGGGGAGAAAAKPAAANDYTANTSSVNESNYAALPKLQREIMELVAKDDTDEGMHVSAVSRGVSGMGQYSGDKVMEAIEFLMTEGSLYSTIDDLHVKAV